ncbi:MULTISPECIES: alginate lyase family protein [Alteromonadaceae]|uniref:Alginate lyase family protein n=1 Tax=Brumicola blandensis TaxID=3075611 RepID=A0AAW8R2X3_9ALTE|nr:MULTISPECIES: alginate lyase family protein [unclassified Alteromonas]MDT0582210.1 alginate lyase family protein [Alteromonas sp. W409]MDT0627834.1 alginate lyase family protein [Alteromonas sp. W364]
MASSTLRSALLLSVVASVFLIRDVVAQTQATEEPVIARLVLLDEQDLLEVKAAYIAAKNKNGRSIHTEAIKLILEQADKAMKTQYLSVTNNPEIPASKDNHDYFSVGPYWWPDKSKKNGLPWIRKDGQTNPTFRGPSADNKMFATLMNASHHLSLAYFFTGDKRYAQKAQRLLSHWFIRAETKMNPHLNFAQSIPGRVHGRGIGIIEFRDLLRILDAVTLIKEVSDQDFQASFNEWTTIFLGWLLESANGQDEAAKENNHGTFYDVLVIGIALHLGFDDLATKITALSKQRVKGQIKKNGKQPHELDRTRPFNYTAFNLVGFTRIANMSDRIGVSLWEQPSATDQRILKALEFAVANLSTTDYWPGKQEKSIDYYKLVAPALLARKAYAENPTVSQQIDQYLQIIASKSEQAKQQLAICAALFNYPYSLPSNNDVKYRSCTY